MGHTPGTWAVNPEEPLIVWSDLGVGSMTVAEARRNAADAMLIAAAPEMLAALHQADDALDYAQAQVDSEGDRLRLNKWRTAVQAAIAKAAGRSE